MDQEPPLFTSLSFKLPKGGVHGVDSETGVDGLRFKLGVRSGELLSDSEATSLIVGVLL